MDILATIEHTIDFWTLIIFLGALSMICLLVCILVIYAAPKQDKGIDGHDIFIFVTFFIVGFLSVAGIFKVYKEGASISYKATITDFNEVYEKGYEIVDQEGEIYILQKSKNQ